MSEKRGNQYSAQPAHLTRSATHIPGWGSGKDLTPSILPLRGEAIDYWFYLEDTRPELNRAKAKLKTILTDDVKKLYEAKNIPLAPDKLLAGRVGTLVKDITKVKKYCPPKQFQEPPGLNSAVLGFSMLTTYSTSQHAPNVSKWASHSAFARQLCPNTSMTFSSMRTKGRHQLKMW